jgi:hypothetical protein
MGRVIKVVEEQEYTAWKSKLKPWYDADIQKQLKAAENLKNHTNTSKQIASNLSIY